MINCREATRLTSLKEEGRLDMRHRIELAIHLLLCKYCKAFAKNSEVLVKAVHQPLRVQLSENEKEKMQSSINEMESKL